MQFYFNWSFYLYTRTARIKNNRFMRLSLCECSPLHFAPIITKQIIIKCKLIIITKNNRDKFIKNYVI